VIRYVDAPYMANIRSPNRTEMAKNPLKIREGKTVGCAAVPREDISLRGGCASGRVVAEGGDPAIASWRPHPAASSYHHPTAPSLRGGKPPWLEGHLQC
jgi:hypothetical protein